MLKIVFLVVICLIQLFTIPVFAGDSLNSDQKRLTPDDTIRFAIIGDYGRNTTSVLYVANLVHSWNVDFVTTVGDNNYFFGEASTIEQNVGAYYGKYIDYGTYKSAHDSGTTPSKFFPTLGNHDYDCTGCPPPTPYLNYFNATIPDSGSGNDRYYDMIKENLELFMVNSDFEETDSRLITGEQHDYFASITKTTPWRIALFHQPPYGTGKFSNTIDMRWDWRNMGVDVAIGGHEHIYEWNIVEGYSVIINGLGGGKISDINTTAIPSYENKFSYNSTWGAILATVDATTMNFTFYNYTGDAIHTVWYDKAGTPGPVTGLITNTVSNSQIDLSWIAPSDINGTLVGYNIDRESPTGSGFTRIVTEQIGTTYSDTELTSGQEYNYKVTAVNLNNTGSGVQASNSSTGIHSDLTTISNAAWLILVILSAIGIGIIILRKLSKLR